MALLMSGAGQADREISAAEFFMPYEKKYTRPALLLRGFRIREGYTQVQLAKLLKVTQANLSKMELGKRAIGKDMAKRIAKIFDTDDQRFL